MRSPSSKVRTIASASATALLLLTLAACDGLTDESAAKTDQQSFPLSGKALTVTSINSMITITTGTGTGVEATRSLSGNAAEGDNSTWRLENDQLTVNTKCTGLVMNCSGKYEFRVPSGTEITVQAQGGAVTLAALDSTITASNDNGSLDVSGSTGELRLRTINSGDVTVTGARSRQVEVTTDTGAAKLAFVEAPEQVRAVTQVGAIDVAVPGGGDGYKVVCSSVNGNASSAIADTPGSSRSLAATSTNGGVTIRPT